MVRFRWFIIIAAVALFSNAPAAKADDDLFDLITQTGDQTCANRCECSFTGINRAGDPDYKSVYTVKRCQPFKAFIEYKKFRHTVSGQLLYSSGKAESDPMRIGELEVDMTKSLCKVSSVNAESGVGINCRINQMKQVDGCKVYIKTTDYTFDHVVDRDGNLFPSSGGGIEQNRKAVWSTISSKVAKVLTTKNRCPSPEVDPGFEYFYTSAAGEATFGPEMYKKEACCCQMTESGQLTSVYECTQASKFDGFDCKGEIAANNTFDRPLQTGKSCSVYNTVNGKSYTAADSNFSIGDTKLFEEAKKLNKLGSITFNDLIGRIIKGLMAFMGMILFVLYIYAGLLWMLAAGNDEQVTKSKNILVWSTLGVAVMLGSYVIVQFLFHDALKLF